MKTVIIGIGTLILSIFVCLSTFDVKTYQRFNQELRFVCEELSAAGALYNDKESYSNGSMVFNQVEANKAIHEQLKALLKANDELVPLDNSYWTDPLQLKTYFYDDSNTVYPSLFIDPDTGYTQTITCPTIIVTILAGKGRFRFPVFGQGQATRSAAHEYKER